jgi:hypothetical protein
MLKLPTIYKVLGIEIIFSFVKSYFCGSKKESEGKTFLIERCLTIINLIIK